MSINSFYNNLKVKIKNKIKLRFEYRKNLEKIENLVESLYKTLTHRRIIFLIIIVLFFFFFQSKIENFIESYLLMPRNFFNFGINLFLIACSIYFSVFFIFKVMRDKYIPSYNELIFCVLSVLIYHYFSFETKRLSWEFVPLNFTLFHFKYIYLLIIPIYIFLSLLFLRFFYSIFIKQPKVSNDYLDDAPIDKIENDELEYETIVNKLTDVLKNKNTQKSFTIGLVGPWGNGKSSIINLVINQLQPKKGFLKLFKESDIIVINFLPYLNHKEEDIISEFFTSLSNALYKYNGKLSNQILEYSRRLTSFYKEKNLMELIDKKSFKSSDIPSKNLYDEINIRLKEVGKKIIVFVDDLDRLNESEILQVLKLIRNTADFNNTIFVVAMDKDYVINRLKANNEILDSKFIDKFFQLEIYLPEIETTILRNYFVKELLKSKLISISNFENRLSTALDNKYNLFDLYVKNFRDVKRIINQISFEYPFFESELDLKDFMNFVYFKLKFPKLIKILNDNRNTLLAIDGSKKCYFLPKIKPTTKNTDVTDKLKQGFIVIDKFININKYQIHEDLNLQNQTVNDIINIDKEDYDLLIKTLVCLFGEENLIENNQSIKFENNFRKLMQQKFLSTDLRESEFQMLFENLKIDQNSKTSDNLPYDLIEKIYDEKKVSELLKRFDYSNTEDVEEVKWSILIIGILYEKRVDYDVNERQVLALLDKFVNKRIELNVGRSAGVGNWIVNNLFKVILSIENRLLLYGEVWKTKNFGNLWDIKEEYLADMAVEDFEEYLNEIDVQSLAVNDYSIYKVFHGIKNIGLANIKLKNIFIDFWETQDIEFLCMQMTDLNSFSLSSFKLSETSAEIFGSFDEFITFVESLKANSKNITEFLELYKLLQIAGFSKEIIFEFKKSSKMIKKIELIEESMSKNSLNEDNDRREVFFESNDKELIDKIFSNEMMKVKYIMSSVVYNEKYYLIVNFSKNEEEEIIFLGFVQGIIRNIFPNTPWQLQGNNIPMKLKDLSKSFKREDKYFKIISIKPELN